MTSVAKSLLRGAQEALEFAKGRKKGVKMHKIEVPAHIDVSAIRKQLHLNRKEFSNRFGFSIRTVEKWEQGIRQPTGSARAYLIVIQWNPEAVEQSLEAFATHEKHAAGKPIKR